MLATASVHRSAARQGINVVILVAASCLLTAGVLHAVITQEHWEHSPAHGIFHLLTAVGELAGGLALLRWHGAALRNAGAIAAGGLVTLLAITRILPAPFHFGPEEWDGPATLALFLQGTIFVALVLLSLRDRRKRALVVAAMLVASALSTGAIAYVAGEAAEPWLPGLWARAPSIVEIRNRTDRRSAAPATLELVVGGIARPLAPDEAVPVRDDLMATLTLQPGDRGARLLDVRLQRSDQALDGVHVRVDGAMRYMDHGAFQQMATAAGGGHYLIPLQFAMPGDWELSLQIGSDGKRSILTLDLDVV